MSGADSTARIVLTTETNAEEANRLGRILVEEHLVACATLVPAVQSIFIWEGHLQTTPETLILFKTRVDKIPALKTRLHELHKYKTPEFLVLPVETVSEPYMNWLNTMLGPRP